MSDSLRPHELQVLANVTSHTHTHTQIYTYVCIYTYTKLVSQITTAKVLFKIIGLNKHHSLICTHFNKLHDLYFGCWETLSPNVYSSYVGCCLRYPFYKLMW